MDSISVGEKSVDSIIGKQLRCAATMRCGRYVATALLWCPAMFCWRSWLGFGERRSIHSTVHWPYHILLR